MTCTEQADEVTTRPSRGELELATHALSGVFAALNWIDGGCISAKSDELSEARASLILAGKQIADGLRARF